MMAVDHDAAIAFIGTLATVNPDDDPHGPMDTYFTNLCRDFDPERTPKAPLTLAEWKDLTRGTNDYDMALGRNILDATDPFVFLVVLRDRLVFSSGCSDLIIQAISVVVDPIIEPRTMTWRSGERGGVKHAEAISVARSLLPPEKMEDTEDAD